MDDKDMKGLSQQVRVESFGSHFWINCICQKNLELRGPIILDHIDPPLDYVEAALELTGATLDHIEQSLDHLNHPRPPKPP